MSGANKNPRADRDDRGEIEPGSSADALSGGAQKVWAVLNTEIGRIPRRDRRGHRSLKAMLDEAELPGEVGSAIRAIVSRTRLWRGEKLDVAQELIAHARDGLDSGVAPAELAAAMGQPKKVARLIRRAMKRKRHWTWHTRAWLFRVVAGTAGVVVVVAGVMTARFFLGDPDPQRNFIAEMNAPFEKYGEDERSWPGLRDVNVAVWAAADSVERDMTDRARARLETESLTDEELALNFDEPGIQLRHEIDRRHPDYGAMVSLIWDLQPTLEKSRELASRPIVGMPYSTRWPSDTDWDSVPRGWIEAPLPESNVVAEQDMLIGVLLPWLGPIRNQCRWLALDARVAADDRDAARVVADVAAMLGYAEQVDKDEILISNLVSLACTELARVTLGRVMHEHPGLLERDQLIGLAHRFGRVRGLFAAIPLEWETNMFEDVLQRAYTDDGHGDGHLTNEGINILSTLSSLTFSADEPISSTVGAADTLFRSSRAEQRRVYAHAMAKLREDEAAGYEIFRGRELESEQWSAERESRGGFDPATLLMPAMGRAVAAQAIGRAKIDGSLVAIGATIYRMDTGVWPASVSELTPAYLPDVPEDPFTGGPMRLGVNGDGSLVVYCVGRDGDDDGGRMDPSKESVSRPKADGLDPREARYFEQYDAVGWGTGREGDPFVEAINGDWVLFPPG